MTRALLMLSLCLAACGRAGAPQASTPPLPVAPTPQRSTSVAPSEQSAPAPVAITRVDSAPSSATPALAPETAPAPATTELLPLSDDEIAFLFSTPEDEPPDRRGGVTSEQLDRHYVAGNEKALHAFYSSIVGIGGGYVGVGSDQAYLFIGWARPEIAWLTDYDPDVVDVHEIYRLCILASDTPEQMLALWDKAGRDRVSALITAEHHGKRAKRLEALYRRNRGWIARRLVAQRKRLRELDVPSWLTEQVDYDYVRELLIARRVRPLLANLLDARGIAGVAESARTLGVPIRVLYLSNAEEYWPRYTTRFRQNLAALPFSEDALVLRTLLIWDVNEDYRYNVQRADNYLQWLKRAFVRNVYDVVHDRPKPTRDALNFFETEGDPETSPAARRAQKAAEPAKRRT